MAAQIKLLLSVLEEDPGINSALTEICQVLRVGFEDKIAQVKRGVIAWLFWCVSFGRFGARCGRLS